MGRLAGWLAVQDTHLAHLIWAQIWQLLISTSGRLPVMKDEAGPPRWPDIADWPAWLTGLTGRPDGTQGARPERREKLKLTENRTELTKFVVLLASVGRPRRVFVLARNLVDVASLQ